MAKYNNSKDQYKKNPIPDIMDDVEFFKYQNMGLLDDTTLRDVIIKTEYKDMKLKTDKTRDEMVSDLAYRWRLGEQTIKQAIYRKTVLFRTPVYETLEN